MLEDLQQVLVLVVRIDLRRSGTGQLLDRFCGGKIDDVIFIASIVPCHLLIWSIPPGAIDLELVFVTAWFEKFDEAVGRLLARAESLTERHLGDADRFY